MIESKCRKDTYVLDGEGRDVDRGNRATGLVVLELQVDIGSALRSNHVLSGHGILHTEPIQNC